jgi:hypothetical protein
MDEEIIYVLTSSGWLKAAACGGKKDTTNVSTSLLIVLVGGGFAYPRHPQARQTDAVDEKRPELQRFVQRNDAGWLTR